ncbi:MAG: DNA alkylation repair protein [Candidatus Saccharimonadaceae bacterium]
MQTAAKFISELEKYANPETAANSQRFFKTGAGQYGEGDVFIGVTMPQVRAVCREFKQLPLAEVAKLCESDIHEYRMAGLVVLTLQYPRAEGLQKQEIFNLYIDQIEKGNVNNWDLVDVTCRAVVGEHLHGTDRSLLYDYAHSDDLWKKRISIIATFPYIASGDPSTSLELAEILVNDPHDLIQKAVGWTLREIGKRCDEQLLHQFLDEYASTMPRTALRYAIERLPEQVRRGYLKRA